MKRKTLVFTIAALFLLTSLSSVYAEFNKLTEFPSAKPTDWDIIVPDDFPTIQEAVDHAQEYSTIMVRSGIYHENVVIEKSLVLHGENKNTTIIDGGGEHWVIQVIKASVTIADFTIQHSGNEFFNKTNAGIMLSKSTNSIIRNNYIKNNYIGI